LKKLSLYKYRSIFIVLFWLALIGSYVFAVLPSDIAPHVPNVSDKAHHVFTFVILGLLLRLAYRINYWYALLVLVTYGVSIEISQYFLPTRFADYNDVVADLIGAFLGLKLYKYLRRVV